MNVSFFLETYDVKRVTYFSLLLCTTLLRWMLQRTLQYQQDNDADSKSLQNDVMTLFSVLYDASSFLNFHKDIFFLVVSVSCFVFFLQFQDVWVRAAAADAVCIVALYTHTPNPAAAAEKIK